MKKTQALQPGSPTNQLMHDFRPNHTSDFYADRAERVIEIILKFDSVQQVHRHDEWHVLQ